MLAFFRFFLKLRKPFKTQQSSSGSSALEGFSIPKTLMFQLIFYNFSKFFQEALLGTIFDAKNTDLHSKLDFGCPFGFPWIPKWISDFHFLATNVKKMDYPPVRRPSGKRPCFSLNYTNHQAVWTYCFLKHHFWVEDLVICCVSCFPLSFFYYVFIDGFQ